MEILPCHIHHMQPGENLLALLDQYLKIEEETIVAITSKIVSLFEHRIVPKNGVSKKSLIQQEADFFLEDPFSLTIRGGILMPAAGIDESNAFDSYILLPKDAQKSASLIWEHLRKRGIKKVGVLITDSRTTPLRRGVVGVALGWCGFSPFFSYVGQEDLLGREFRMTLTNTLDALAAASVFVMGEGNEQTPIAKIIGAPRVHFLDRKPSKEEDLLYQISLEEDIYAPFWREISWKQ